MYEIVEFEFEGRKYLIDEYGIEIDGRELTKYDLLAIAINCCRDNFDAAMQTLELLSKYCRTHEDKTFDTLLRSTYHYVANATNIYEVNIHHKFADIYKSILGDNVELVDFKNDPKHIPDFWVNIDGEYIPVEIKLHKFNKRALDQLKRYMKFYKANKGIAIGTEAAVEIPSNITFISTNDILEAHKSQTST